MDHLGSETEVSLMSVFKNDLVVCCLHCGLALLLHYCDNLYICHGRKSNLVGFQILPVESPIGVSTGKKPN